MKRAKPIKKSFITNVFLSIDKLAEDLSPYANKITKNKYSLVIREIIDIDKVKEIIKNTIKVIFNCKKYKNYCKLNMFDGVLYIRFKKCI